MIASVLPLLRCPRSRQALCWASKGEVEKLNNLIAAGGCQNMAGRPVGEKIEDLLLTSDRVSGYLVRDGIPILLPDEAITGVYLESSL